MFLLLARAEPKDGLSAGTCLGERYDDGVSRGPQAALRRKP